MMRLEIPLGVRHLTIFPDGHWFLKVEESDTLGHVFGFDLESLHRGYPRIWRVVQELADHIFLSPETM